MFGRKIGVTYKRKRLSSRPGLGFEYECPDQTHVCQTLEVLKPPGNEKVITHESESDRRDPEKLNRCALYNGESNVLPKCEYCHCFYDVKGRFPSNDDNDGKKLCSSCVKQQDRLSTLEKVGNSCEDTMKVKKWGFPLVTFSRRSRQKKTVDATAVQEKSIFVEKYDLVAVKRIVSTIDNGCLLDISTKTIEDVDLCDVGSLSVPQNETEKSTKEVLTPGSCFLKDTPLIAESSGKSHVDATSYDKDKSLKVSQSLVFAADESRIISSNDVESGKITIDKKRDEGSLASFDLSKSPPELSGLVDCNLTLECSSNGQPYKNVSDNHRESTDSTSRSHSIEFPSRSRVVDLTMGAISTYQLHCVPPRHSSMWAPSVSIGQSQTANNNLLQLFPEDRVNDILPPSNRKHLHSTCSTGSFNFENRSAEPIQDIVRAQYPIDPVSLMRHEIMLHNILSKTRGVKSKFDPPNVWSEEELDFLWIGVRRHGMGSWDAILSDPSLHFSSWRSPRELAERWEEEQSNLLRTKPTKKNNPILVQEPRGRSTFDPFFVNAPKGNSNLPHWLSRPVEQVRVPSVSYTGHSGLMQWINQPFSGSNRTIDKLGPELQPVSCTTHWAVQPIATRQSSKPDEVIVIDSDPSSEETISEDGSVRN